MADITHSAERSYVPTTPEGVEQLADVRERRARELKHKKNTFTRRAVLLGGSALVLGGLCQIVRVNIENVNYYQREVLSEYQKAEKDKLIVGGIAQTDINQRFSPILDNQVSDNNIDNVSIKKGQNIPDSLAVKLKGFDPDNPVPTYEEYLVFLAFPEYDKTGTKISRMKYVYYGRENHLYQSNIRVPDTEFKKLKEAIDISKK